MAPRVKRWSNTKFAGHIRTMFGVSKKPSLSSIEEWNLWKTANSNKFGYVISEKWLNLLQDFMNIPRDIYHKIKIYVENRFITKTHILQTNLKKGEWYDIDYRLLHGVMETVVNYVEEELGWMEWAWTGNGTKAGWNRLTKKQKYDLGIKRLEWEASLKVEWHPLFGDEEYGPTEQAFRAMELMEIMDWWTRRRPERPDPYTGSEYDLELDADYCREDTDMLIRLMKIRRSLWT